MFTKCFVNLGPCFKDARDEFATLEPTYMMFCT